MLFLINGTKNFTLINCTYTTCILQLLIHRKQRSHHYKHLNGRKCRAPRWPHRPPPKRTCAPQKGRVKEKNSTAFKTEWNKKETTPATNGTAGNRVRPFLPGSPQSDARSWSELCFVRHLSSPFSLKSYTFRRWGSHRRCETLLPGEGGGGG